MMFKSKLLLVSLSFSSLTIPQLSASYYRRPVYPTYNAPQNDPISDVGKAALGVGCLAALGYGMYKFCDWLFSASDNQIITDAQQTIANAHRSGDSLISFFNDHLHSFPPSPREQKALIALVNENFLFEICTRLQHERSSLSAALSNCEQTMSYLRSAHQSLNNRINKLHNSNAPIMAINLMKELDEQTYELLSNFEFIASYLAHHKSYGHLFDLEFQLLNSYEQELALTNSHESYDTLRACIMRYGNKHHTNYPYVKYAQKLNNECISLERAMDVLGFGYANRLNAAQFLLARLKSVYNFVITQDAYRQELRDQERAELERQRIEAERSKAAAAHAHAQAAQAQASAMQQQTWELAKQNQLHAQQIYVDQERNAIMATQTLVNAFNPPQAPVNIYVTDYDF